MMKINFGKRAKISLRKRIISTVLTLTLVLGLIPFADLGHGNVVEATAGVFTNSYSGVNGKKGSRIRGVVWNCSEMPNQVVNGVTYTIDGDNLESNKYKDWLSAWQSGEVGTAQRPFTILELVPYSECANIGYHIDGCEPVYMNRICGNSRADDFSSSSTIYGDLFYYYTPAGRVYFFADEEEGDRKFYGTNNADTYQGKASERITESTWDNTLKKTTPVTDCYEGVEGVTGYYEMVASDGDFKYTTVEGKRKIVKISNKSSDHTGNLVWHSVNEYCREEVKAADKNFDGFVVDIDSDSVNLDEYYKLSKIGDRFYAVRKNSATDPCYDVSSYYKAYKNKDSFCKAVLGLTDEQAANYSIVVKTITPRDLNACPKWADFADLICIYGTTRSQPALIKMWTWKDVRGNWYNKYQKQWCGRDLVSNPDAYNGDKYPSDTVGEYSGKYRQLSWPVVARIVNRVAAARNYCGLVIDKSSALDDVINSATDVQVGRYKLDGTRVGTDTFGMKGSDNSIYKLWLMCTTVSPGLVKRYFIDKGFIVGSGDKNTGWKINLNNRTGKEATHWSAGTFYLGAEDWPETKLDSMSDEQKTQYWTKYEGWLNATETPRYVNGHVYTTAGDKAMTTDFLNGVGCTDASTVTRFSSFNNYLNTNEKTKAIYCSIKGQTGEYYDANIDSDDIESWAALRYILDLDNDVNYYLEEVKILDIEPSVGLSSPNSKPVWKLTEEKVKDFFPRYLSIDISGQYLTKPTNNYGTKLVIDHMLSSEFVGKNDDINSDYDIVYLGDDAGGFWTVGDVKAARSAGHNMHLDSAFIKTVMEDGTEVGTEDDSRTDFYDKNLDGLVYFHIGDLLNLSSGEYTPWQQSVKVSNINQADFVGSYNKTTKTMTAVSSTQIRQPGNDITSIKKDALESFLKGGKIIIVADNLLEDGYVQKTDGCIMYSFLENNKSSLMKESEIGGFTESMLPNSLENKIRKMYEHPLKVLSHPTEYYYKNDASTIHYLNRKTVNDNNYAYMDFKLQVPSAEGYYYKIYYDTDRNAKFESYDCQWEGYVNDLPDFNSNTLTGTATANVPNGWVGFIQWRIEVFEKTNPDHRASMEGCSANSETASEKNKITALQIVSNQIGITRNGGTNTYSHPGDDWFQGTDVFLDSAEWEALYQKVEDQGIFDISVDVVTWDEYNKIFEDAYLNSAEDEADRRKFEFHMGTAIGPILGTEGEPLYNDAGEVVYNPDSSLLSSVENSMCGTRKLGDYNMIVIGFGDGYGLTDLDNRYGAAEYLYYFIENDCSILFTHDLTCYFNEPKARVNGRPGTLDRTYGYTANILMRDLMGMNRYGVLSKYITMDSDYFRSDLVEDLLGYRVGSQGKDADEVKKKTIHYDSTIQNQKQGFSLWGGLEKIGGGGSDYSTRSQYKYLCIDPDDLTYHDMQNGATGDNNCETSLAVRLNKGQITQYPFTIDENLTIRSTHAQYYELNMEEPELTVWYTLEDTKQYGKGGRSSASLNSSVMYAVTPHNASNNYYIYSKGNAFYSGVGHRSINNDEERRLFVNTLIAAYRPKTDKPQVLITNEGHERTGSIYTIRLDQDFAYGSDGKLLGADVTEEEPLYVTFIPKDSNNEEYIRVRACFSGENNSNFQVYDTKIENGKKVAGNPIAPMAVGGTVTEANTFYLKVDHEYVISYDRDEINARNHIVFKSENSGNIGNPSITDLHIKSRPMFVLD